MKVSYKKTINGNFMIIDCEDPDACIEEFATEMMRRNHIEPLLDITCESINGSPQFLYNITSRQSLRKLFEIEKCGAGLISSLASSLTLLFQSLEEYLLDPEKILFDLEYIFTDAAKKQFYFCLLPLSSVNDFSLASLFNQLLSVIDYDDPECVSLAFSLNRKVQSEFFTVRDLAQVPSYREFHEEAGIMVREEEVLSYIEEDLSEPAETDLPEKPDEPGFFGKAKIYFKGKSFSETLEALNSWDLIKNIRAVRTPVKVFHEPEPFLTLEARDEEEFDLGFGPDPPPSRPLSAEDPGPLFNSSHISPATPRRSSIENTASFRMPPSDSHYITGLGDFSSIEKVIEDYPFTIGSMKDSVSLFIDEPFISKLHLKIIKSENDPSLVFVEDMNSTNGSLLNGKRLEPYTKMPLCSGDILNLAGLELLFK